MSASGEEARSQQGEIVEALILDLSDRSGLQQAWESIDDEVQAELKGTWAGIIARQLQLRQESRVLGPMTERPDRYGPWTDGNEWWWLNWRGEMVEICELSEAMNFATAWQQAKDEAKQRIQELEAELDDQKTWVDAGIRIMARWLDRSQSTAAPKEES